MKKKFTKNLNEIRKILLNLKKSDLLNSDVYDSSNDLCDDLENELRNVEWESLDSKSASRDTLYPVPDEFEGLDIAYALFSDGACRGNPGPGSWGCIAQDIKGDVLFESSGAEHQTTNNKMEIQGGIQAFNLLNEYLADHKLSFDDPVFFYCDSKYVVDGLSKWIPGWKRRGWKKSDNKEPESLELWKQLDESAASFKNLKCIWVKAHAGHPQNERCDELANIALDEWLN